MEHGQKAKATFPQWEKDYHLQPMNAHGLFDEYLEMSMLPTKCLHHLQQARDLMTLWCVF